MSDEDLRVGGTVVIPASELVWRFSRSSGPGGQSVNTTDSRVELLFDVSRSPSLSETQRQRAISRLAGRLVDGVLAVSSSRQRSQWQNRREARRALQLVLESAIAPPQRTRRPTSPSRGSVERRLAAKRRRSEVKRWRRPDAE